MVIKKANFSEAKRRTHAFKWAAKLANQKSNVDEKLVSDLHYLSTRMLKMEGRLMRLEADQSLQGQDLHHLIKDYSRSQISEESAGAIEKIERQI